MMSVPNILGVAQDETMAVEISQHQFSIHQEANGQFCNIHAPLQLLANPPSCMTALYAKNTANIPPDVHYKSGTLKASVNLP